MTGDAAMPGVAPIAMRGYAHPEVLVSTDWVEEHREDPRVCIMECDEDVLLYEVGHVPGAVRVDWVADLNDALTRDYIDHEALQAVLRRRGVKAGATIVLYGDKNNWWATYAFWVFRLFGIDNLRIMDGGRAKWEAEGRPMSNETPRYPAGDITVGRRSEDAIRALRQDVFSHLDAGGRLVDVRSPEEYRGERLHMPEYPNEGALRGGHIPGAASVPWARAVNPDTHTFRPRDELERIYGAEAGLEKDEDVIVYCRIGERSSHTWFTLTYLLGFEKVRNYDGSWTEWGNMVRAPIER